MNTQLISKDPIAPQLMAALQLAIVRMQLRPGEALSEKHIADRYGVSRQPVREAFIKLSEAGLVEIRPSRGTYVLKISVAAIAHARFVREAVECAVARRATLLVDAAGMARLDNNLAMQRKAAASDDRLSFYDLDETFHHILSDIVGCDFAGKIVDSARLQTDRVRFISLTDVTPMARLIAQHERIAECLRAGDPEGAVTAMRRHLREILIALPRVAAAHPDFFSDTELPRHTVGMMPEDTGD